MIVSILSVNVFDVIIVDTDQNEIRPIPYAAGRGQKSGWVAVAGG